MLSPMQRAVISILWFLAFLCLHELVWSIAGSPRMLGLAFGSAAAAFVLMDPVGMLRRGPKTDVATPTLLAPSTDPGRSFS